MWRILVIVALSVLVSANLAMMAASAQDLTDETPSPAMVHDLDGDLLDRVIVGQQVILSDTFVNERSVSQPCVAIFEVRDSDGFTVYLTWQSGTVAAGGQADVGVSWIANETGTHSIRTIFLSSLSSPEALDVIWERSIPVVDADA